MANIPQAEFNIIRGTSETLTIQLYKSDGTVLDLTGNSAMSLYVGDTLNDSSLLMTKTLTLASGYAATSGRLTYAFVPSDTSALAPGNYIAEVHITYASTAEYRTEQPFDFNIIERVKQ
jgi:hypothetical protein